MVKYMKKIKDYLGELTRIFKQAVNKHDAHFQSKSVMEDIASDPDFLAAVLNKHLATPGGLNKKHYPVVGLNIENNEFYNIVANCWIPLPGGETNISTKAIHHHGNMLLSTATIFGHGYEHWTFTQPQIVDATNEIFYLEVIENKLHALHHVAFVDSYIAHVPFYPPSLTITLALWSNKYPTTWKDRLKRIPIFKGNEAKFRQLATNLGIAKALDIKIVEYFDFYPTNDGFKGMKQREEFKLGPNVDYLYSLFHILQQTSNEGLAPLIQQQLNSSQTIENRSTIQQLLKDLQCGNPIDGKLSDRHYGVPYANFTKQDVENALKIQRSKIGNSGSI